MPKQKNNPTDPSKDKQSRASYEPPKLTVFGHVGALSQAGTGMNNEFVMMNMQDTGTMRQRI